MELDIKTTGNLDVTMVMLDLPADGHPQYGIAHVDFTFGGAPLTGIAMIARYLTGSVHKYVTSDWDHAREWYTTHDATEDDLAELLAAWNHSMHGEDE